MTDLTYNYFLLNIMTQKCAKLFHGCHQVIGWLNVSDYNAQHDENSYKYYSLWNSGSGKLGKQSEPDDDQG